MRLHWNRNHARNGEAANDRLRQRYEDRRHRFGSSPVAVPDQLQRAIRDPRWSGEPVLVSANGRDVAAVLGTESTDAWAIWRDITAAVQADMGQADMVQADMVQADEGTGTGVRLIPPASLAKGLRAVAVPSEQQVVVWQSSAESVTNRQRRIAARRALRALDGPKVPPAVRLSLLVPGWRRTVPIAAVATGAVVIAVLISTGQMWPLNRRPSSPAATATHQATAGTRHRLAPTVPSSDRVGRHRNSRAAGGAPSRHRGTGAVPAGSASASAPASATKPQPPPTPTSSSPSPRPTAKKKCSLSVLGVCLTGN